jgi:glutathionylspermidine synthase
MEDHQIVAHVGDALRQAGMAAHVLSVEQLDWTSGRARCDAGEVDLVFRFYQAEWLARLPRHRWERMFFGGETQVVNPGVAALSESKRLPLIWDELRTPLPTWRRVLPETRALADAPWATDEGWLIKKAYSNTGDTVSIRSAMSTWGWARRVAAARVAPSQWVAQRRFSVVPVGGDQEPAYPCIGVYVIDGKAAGCYARLTDGPVVTFAASDVALLIYDDA